jgi:hypothetical protein
VTTSDRPVVLVLAVHPRRVAATRLRATQYTPHWEQAGHEVRLWTFLSDHDLHAWYGRSQVTRALVLLRAILRLPTLYRAVRGVSVVVVQREALPLGPPLLELLAAKGRALVWDVDDAVWEDFSSPTAGHVPQWLRATGDKYSRLCRRADDVWAGSEVLARWCRERNENVVVVPTVVPVPAERPPVAQGRTVGWVGSHSTGPFLRQVLPAVARVEPHPEVVVVGAEVEPVGGLRMDAQPWSQSSEDSALQRIRVGLYPVDREHPLAEGKCGLKAILYMSHGIPSLVTPTSTNAAVVRHGVEGLHADGAEQWTESAQRLLDDEALWERMSVAAHRRARDEYSLETWGPRLADRLTNLARRL